MTRCTRCSGEFVLFAAAGETLGGCTVNGAPCCWECFEEAARETERGAQPETAVHR